MAQWRRQTFAIVKNLEDDGTIVSLKNLPEYQTIINTYDFMAVLGFETLHPELYQGALPATRQMSWPMLAAMQMHSINWALRRYHEELLTLRALAERFDADVQADLPN
ncbi:hypothetical protein WJX72_011212 [[Myrmecia] bisecta]|uniref:Uncharacterized protein n=1 Tax=[Myrmecia] bisecta TaxID=41462 RepID=A0AAW1Q175_9CHLO